ncbi:MAG: ferrous iron transport protein A [Elusimicrobiota bacterium]|jgi:Fe2+ transport system protein FeoA|nr:ferrous iron transport protein A [Elusimicrobiota bacterium]
MADNESSKQNPHDDKHRHHLHHDHHCHHHHHNEVYENLISLSIAPEGEYTFITLICEPEIEHRLLEMGFIPGAEIKIVTKTGIGENSSVMIEIKGSKLALNNKIANEILVKAK